MAYVYTQNGTSDVGSGAASGRVGIGTSNPATDLHVYSSSYSTSAKLEVSGGSYPRLKLEGGGRYN